MFWWPGHTFPVYPKAAFSLLGGSPFPILIILPFTLHFTPAAILSQMCSSFTFLSSFHLRRVWFKFAPPVFSKGIPGEQGWPRT